MRRWATALTAIAVLFAANVCADTIPSFRGLGHLPGDVDSGAYGVARDGSAVAGYSAGAGGYEAFLWTAQEGMIGLGHLDPTRPASKGFAVANAGVAVVGDSRVAQPFHAFRWTPQHGMVDLGDLPGGDEYSGARGVSPDGSVVVGFGRPTGHSEAFRWTAETGMVGLGFLPGHVSSSASHVSADGSVTVGSSFDPHATQEAFRWTANQGMVGLGDLPGGAFPLFSGALAVSADGYFIVGYGESSEGVEAVRWTADGEIMNLGDLPGGYTDAWAWGVSANGSIVVGQGTLEGSELFEYDAFIWDEQHGMRLLKDVLEDDYGLDLTGWRLIAGSSVSDDGCTIVGRGLNPGGHLEAWIARIPEPSTSALVIVVGLTARAVFRGHRA